MGEPRNDDRVPGDDSELGVVRFSFEASQSGCMWGHWRSDLVSVLQAFHGCDRPDDVVIALGELVSNGLEHGGGVRRVHVDGFRGVVTVEVEDCSPSLPHPRADHAAAGAGLVSDRGLGLLIVDDVADRWGWWPTGAGKTVWAEFLPQTHVA